MYFGQIERIQPGVIIIIIIISNETGLGVWFPIPYGSKKSFHVVRAHNDRNCSSSDLSKRYYSFLTTERRKLISRALPRRTPRPTEHFTGGSFGGTSTLFPLF